MIEEKDKMYERISGALLVLGIGWLIVLNTSGPLLFSKAIEQLLPLPLMILAAVIYTVGRNNDKIPKIDTDIEIEYRRKKEN